MCHFHRNDYRGYFDIFGENFDFHTFKNDTFQNDTFESIWVDASQPPHFYYDLKHSDCYKALGYKNRTAAKTMKG